MSVEPSSRNAKRARLGGRRGIGDFFYGIGFCPSGAFGCFLTWCPGHPDISDIFGHVRYLSGEVKGADVPDKRTGHFSLLENVRFVRVRPDLGHLSNPPGRRH